MVRTPPGNVDPDATSSGGGGSEGADTVVAGLAEAFGATEEGSWPSVWPSEPPACSYDRHRPWDWRATADGRVICGVCHPPVVPVAKEARP